MQSLPDSESTYLTGPETKGVSLDELKSMSEEYQGLSQLINSDPPTTKPSPVVLLTGAGASRPLGMPTMVEFKNNFSDNLLEKERILWDNIATLSAESYKTTSDALDIEQVLTYIDNCEVSYDASTCLWERIYEAQHGTPTIEQIHDFRQELWSLRNGVLDKICATYRNPKPLKVVECYDPLFRVLKSVSGQVATNVFTTNYDLTFEVLAKTKPDDFELVDGFETLPSGEEVFKKQHVPTLNGGHAIVLWKLHGSTSWKGKLPNWDFVKAAPGKYIHPDGERTIIIYPTRNKSASQNLFASPFNQAYGRLSSLFSQIKAVQVLLVIGYAFGDAEIGNMIGEGLASESRATVIVVDPTATQERVTKAFPKIDASRFRIIPQKFCEEGTMGKIEEELRSSLATCR